MLEKSCRPVWCLSNMNGHKNAGVSSICRAGMACGEDSNADLWHCTCGGCFTLAIPKSCHSSRGQLQQNACSSLHSSLAAVWRLNSWKGASFFRDALSWHFRIFFRELGYGGSILAKCSSHRWTAVECLSLIPPLPGLHIMSLFISDCCVLTAPAKQLIIQVVGTQCWAATFPYWVPVIGLFCRISRKTAGGPSIEVLSTPLISIK